MSLSERLEPGISLPILVSFAEDDVVQSCKELVEVWRIVVRHEVRRGPHIILARAQPPVLDALCAQRQAKNISLESTTVKLIGTHRVSPHAL